MTADLIVKGKIFTADEKQSVAEAMAVADGRILAVGLEEDVRIYEDEHTETLEVSQGMVMPGMAEGHAHISSTTELIFGARLMDGESVAEYQRIIREFMEAHPDERVITGGGFENGVFGSIGPTAGLLDEVSREIPIIMISSDHHSHWVNSKAMELVGLTEATEEIANGVIVRYPGTQKPTGWLKESAAAILNPIMPVLTEKHYREALLYYQDTALENGVTIAFEPMFDKKKDYAVRYNAYEELAKENKLKVTFRIAYSIEANDDVKEAFAEAERVRVQLAAYDKVQMNTIKLFVDGVVEGHTAYLREEYADAPGDYGEPTYTQEEMNDRVERSLEKGFDIHTHAIGDAAIDEALNAYERAQAKQEMDYRNAITHLQVMVPEHVKRMKELNVVAVTNPYWHFKNPVYYDALEVPFLGAERASKEYYMASMKNAGIVMSQASDFPVTVPPRTMDALHIMVNRKEPGKTDMEPLGEKEELTVEEALQVLTIGGAYQNRLEGKKGSLEAGKDADFVVLDKDVLTLPKEELYTAEVKETYIAGQMVWHR